MAYNHLAGKGYYEAIVPQKDYIIVFRVKVDYVNVVGIFRGGLPCQSNR